ncbi:hypothetical protein BSKO_03668 [Bryopsis sp. KO-2023]|nr:hypothetical protein BSKO_03668 [Bryopsis sp. KO-2023]
MPRGSPVVYNRASVYDVIKHYDVKEDIGFGGYAVVKKGLDKRTGELVAIKIVDKTKYDPGDDRLQHEIEVLMKIDHPRCIRLYDVFIAHQKVFIVTEYVTGGEVLERLQKHGPYSERAASTIIRHVIEGVAYLHENGVVHRDLKLENLLMVNERLDSDVKIADFGLSKYFGMDESVLATVCGSPEYVAPEVLGVEETSENYGSAVDMWSVGVVLFAMMCCYTPFYDENQSKMYKNIMDGHWNRRDPNWMRLSLPLKNLIDKLLLVDPSARLSAKEALAHPWVQGICFPKNAPMEATHPYADIVHQQLEEEEEEIFEDCLEEVVDEAPPQETEMAPEEQMAVDQSPDRRQPATHQVVPNGYSVRRRFMNPTRGSSTIW